MLQYLGDIMEDASDFSWQSAKASHAVLLCEMERGKVTWLDTTRIDRMRRAYAQKHQNNGRQNWGSKIGEKSRGFANSIKVGPVYLIRTMKLGVELTSTFVPIVCHKVNNSITRNTTATLQRKQ